MYRFEWNYEGIKSQEDFERFVSDIKNEKRGVNYEQAARLFYQTEDGKQTVMIELQVPTKDMIELTEEDEQPWLEAFEVLGMEDYDASKEIDSAIGNGEVFTFENAEQKMLEYAVEMIE